MAGQTRQTVSAKGESEIEAVKAVTQIPKRGRLASLKGFDFFYVACLVTWFQLGWLVG